MKLFVALPIYGAVDPFFLQSIVQLIHQPPCHIQFAPLVGDSLVSRARNTLTAQFLRSDCTHMLFIDSDLIFSCDHIRRIMSHPEPLVGGLYPKKQQGDVAWVINTHINPPPPTERGLQEVRYVGTGFMRIARHVFEDMIIGGAVQPYKPDHAEATEYDFWSVGVYPIEGSPRGRYLSEDWYFCQRWLDLGGQVYADTRIVLKHCGHAIYPLRTQESSFLQPFVQAAPLPRPGDNGAGVPTLTPAPTL